MDNRQRVSAALFTLACGSLIGAIALTQRPGDFSCSNEGRSAKVLTHAFGAYADVSLEKDGVVEMSDDTLPGAAEVIDGARDYCATGEFTYVEPQPV